MTEQFKIVRRDAEGNIVPDSKVQTGKLAGKSASEKTPLKQRPRMRPAEKPRKTHETHHEVKLGSGESEEWRKNIGKGIKRHHYKGGSYTGIKRPSRK